MIRISRREGFQVMLGAAAAAMHTQAGATSTYTDLVLGYSPDWYLPLGDTIATALVGARGTYRNNPQLGVGPIAQGDPGGRSVGFSGATSATPHITVPSPLIGPDLTIDLVVQLDDVTKAKHVLATTALLNEGFSVEILKGGQVRAFSRTGSRAHPFAGTAGDVPQGEAVKITYQRQSSVTEWSQRIYVNGMKKAEDETPRTWAAVPAGIAYIGAWWDGVNFLDPTDGLIAHVAGWNRLLAPEHIEDLVRTQTVAWAENIEAGSVTFDTSKVISVKQGGWHGKEPLLANAGQGALGTTSESGPDITYTAGIAAGNDTFPYSFADADGRTSPTRTVSIDVVASQRLPMSIAEIESRSGKTVTKRVDAAGGSDFKSLQAALNAAVAGDVIAVRGGKYFETISLTGKQATSGNPIEIWGWHPDGATAPTITTEVQNAPTWTLSNSSLGIYSATVPGANGSAYGYLPDNEGGWQLLDVFTGQTSFELTGERYIGPTMRCSGTTVFVRTQTDQRQSVRLVPDGILSQALPVQKNPNNWSGFRFSVKVGYGFQFSDCAHIHFNWLNWFGGQHGILLNNNTHHLSFVRGWLRWARKGVLITAQNIKFDHFAFRQLLPPWLARDDYKADTASNGAANSINGFNDPCVHLLNASNVEIGHCTFEYPSDVVLIGGQCFNFRLHHCLAYGIKDDSLQAAMQTYNMELDHNVFLGFAGPGHNEGSSAPDSKQGQVYLHHNIVDTGNAPYKLGLISFGRNTSSGQPQPFAYGNERLRGAHGSVNAAFPYRMWNNTYIYRDQRANGSHLGYVYGDTASRVPTLADKANELWNSIVISPTGSALTGASDSFGDVVDPHPERSTNTPVCMMDGIMFAKASGGAPMLRGVTTMQGGKSASSFTSLSAYKASAKYPASESAKYPQVPRRWNGNSLEEDPRLNNGTLAGSINYTLNQFGRFQPPANWSMFKPANTKCTNQGVNIGGRWASLAAPDGPNSRAGIETGRARFYIGAINPVDDPTGSALGPQP